MKYEQERENFIFVVVRVKKNNNNIFAENIK